MIYKKIKNMFNNTSDLKYKKIRKIEVIYLESLCSSDKVNEYILQNITIGKDYLFLKNIVSGPNSVFIKEEEIADYLVNGFAIVFDKLEIIAVECKADLYRSINVPSSEPAVNGPKDSFNESIQMNLGLIKRRVRSENLINEDFTIGRKGKTQVSILYIKDVAKDKFVKDIRNKINSIDIDAMIDSEVLQNKLEDSKVFLPTIIKTERPDKVSSALFEGKIVIIMDNSPYALILPGFFVDFLNPEGDNYAKAINVNFLKILRIAALFLTIFLPALYISIINYNTETIPLNLLLSFQSAHAGVPFTSTLETIIMILLCAMLRESDIRFPSNYGSSISILGALILGEAAVAANIVSPITIIIVAVTFIAGLIFNNGNFIAGIRYYRFFLLILAALFGLYGIVIGTFILIIHLVNIKSFGEPYLYPLAPYDKTYIKKTVLKDNVNKKRSKVLSNNEYRVKR